MSIVSGILGGLLIVASGVFVFLGEAIQGIYALILGCVLMYFSWWEQKASVGKDSEKFYYTVVRFNYDENLEQLLEGFAKEGWRLVATLVGRSNYHEGILFFERKRGG